MKLIHKRFCKNGIWSIKSRNAYTIFALKSIQTEYKYQNLFLHHRFLKYLFEATSKNKLTRTAIAKTLGFGRTTLYKIVWRDRKITKEEADIINAICLESEIERAYSVFAMEMGRSKLNWKQMYGITE